jgi:hypothetical protein
MLLQGRRAAGRSHSSARSLQPAFLRADADDEWLQAALALSIEILGGDPALPSRPPILRHSRSHPGLGTPNCVDQVVHASSPRQRAWISARLDS